MEIIGYIFSWWTLGVFVGLWLTSSIMIVGQKTAQPIEVFGKFWNVKHAGLRFKFPWPFAFVAGKVSLRVQQLQQTVSVKTKDNVFVGLPVTVQYKVEENNVYKAFYELEAPEEQIEAYILNEVRSQVNTMALEEVYSDKDRLQKAIIEALEKLLDDYGYTIKNVLVDEPELSNELERAYNNVMASQREKEAASNEAEAIRVREVGKAEAAKQSKKLQGEGIADQRDAIAKGFSQAVQTMKEGLPSVTEDTLVALLTMTNQFEAIRDASDSPSTTILMPYSGDGALGDLNKMVASLQAVNQAGSGGQSTAPTQESQPSDA